MSEQVNKDAADITAKCKKDRFLTVSFNNNCVFRCKMCQLWKNKNSFQDRVSIERLKDTVQSLKNLDGYSIKGVTFAGGEPLAELEILDLVHFAAQEGFFTVMSSNGYLIDTEMAKRINSSGLHSINLSLDSFQAQTHDFIRGVKGSYQHVIEAMENLSRFCSGLSIGICTVIMKYNLGDLVDLIEWVNQDTRIDGIAFQAIVQPFNTIYEREWYLKDSYSFLWPDNLPQTLAMMDRLIDFKRSGYSKIRNPVSQLEIFKDYFAHPGNFIKNKKCNIGDKALTVNEAGDVSFCYLLGTIGNIKKFNIKEILFSEKADEMIAKMDRCTENCNLLVNCCYEDE